MSARAVARPGGGRVESRRTRWNRIAIEALKQCRRGDLMAVEPAASLDAVLARRPSVDLGIFFWENAAAPLSAGVWPKTPSGPSSVLIVLGPEGGFSESEARAAEAQGFHLAGLGPRILRAETAAVAACAVVQYLFGDLGTSQKNLDNPGEVA
jgi:16S rRNA (uracil1498-N3)-methyltransferase